ncbi:MAG: endonuclease MutS2 [Fimbriimonadaceae bacterium]
MRHALQVLQWEEITARLAKQCESPHVQAIANELLPSFDFESVEHLLARTSDADRLFQIGSVPSLRWIDSYDKEVTYAAKGGILGAQELFQISEGVRAARSLRQVILKHAESLPVYREYASSITDLKALEELISGSISPDGEVLDSASPTLAKVRAKKRSIGAQITEKIQSLATGRYREYLSDPIYTLREGRYVLPVRVEHRGKVPGIVHDSSSTGQTVFVEPSAVVDLGNELRVQTAQERDEVVKILAGLSEAVGAKQAEITASMDVATELAVDIAKVRLSHSWGGFKPQLRKSDPFVTIDSGKHPLIEAEKIVPVSIGIGAKENVLIITGPNTGGKTAAIKMVGLFLLMMQAGIWPPATRIEFSPFVEIWADVGDEQSLQQSLSTFSGHLKNIAEALKSAKPGSLVLLDEVGAGTDPAEGAPLARAILTEFDKLGAKVIASTHYGELKDLGYSVPGFANCAMEFDVKTLRPTYRLLYGAPGSSHALSIAERHGIPKDVIEAAKTQLGPEFASTDQLLRDLDLATRRARSAQGEADRISAGFKKREQELLEKLKTAEEAKLKAQQRANEKLEAEVRAIRRQAEELFEELKEGKRDKATTRKDLKALEQIAGEMRETVSPITPQPSVKGGAIEVGDAVRLKGARQTGTVIELLEDGRAVVQQGILKWQVGLDEVERIEAVTKSQSSKPKPASTPGLGLGKSLQVKTEVNLRQLRAEEAELQLEKYLDDAILAGLSQVRIIHGRSGGVLRNITHRLLKKSPHVRSFRLADEGEGGSGVTIAIL